MLELRTPRLVLRRWRPEDLGALAAMDADPVVMEYFPSPMSRDESEAMMRRMEAGFEERGFGLWAVEPLAPGEGVAGYCGLSVPRVEAPFTPCVEVGWRLRREPWGKGYATEAARASIADGFGRVGLAIDRLQVPPASASRPSLHLCPQRARGALLPEPRAPAQACGAYTPSRKTECRWGLSLRSAEVRCTTVTAPLCPRPW
jgi:RimJ/RimL family protein N-acetyltransferase